MSQEPIQVRTKRLHYEFNPTDQTIHLFSVRPDSMGMSIVRGKCLVKLRMQEIKERPDLENILFQCMRLWFPHWWQRNQPGH